MLKSIFSAIIAMLSAVTASVAAPHWEFSDTDAGWNVCRNLEATPGATGLTLNVTGAYSHLGNYRLDIVPEEIGTILITYKASGFPKLSTGRMFFATEVEPKLDERKKIVLPPLVADGQWHTLRIASDQTTGGRKLWYDGKKITRIRLDLAPQHPGEIVLKSIVMAPSPATLLRQAGIPETIPVTLGKTPPPRRFLPVDPNQPCFQSPMAAPSGQSRAVGDAFLRREFTVSAMPVKATLQIAADDRIEALYVNGKPVPHRWSTNWQEPDTADLTPFIRPGKNLLAIHYRNNGAAGGVMFDLGMNFADGQFTLITAADSSGCFGKAPDGWNAVDFADARFAPAECVPGPPTEPWWTAVLPYQEMRPPYGEVRIEGIQADGAVAEAILTGVPAWREDEKFYARIHGADGKLLAFRSGTLKELNGRISSDGKAHITFRDFDLPRYGGAIDGQWEFGVYGRRAISAPSAAFHLAARPMPGGQNPVFKVETTPGGPIATRNGKPFYFNILTVNNPAIPTGMEGSGSPFNVIVFRAGGLGQHWWIGPGRYDFTAVDRVLSQFAEAYPDSYLGLYIWCQPGLWYEKQYPERISRQDNGAIMHYYVSTVTFSDPDYRRDAAAAVAALIEHCEKYFGSRMALYSLMGGASCEWQGWNAHTNHLADYSTAARRDFKNFLKRELPECADIGMPSPAQRLAADDGTLFRNLARDRSAILYDRYYSESIADCIGQLAGAAKTAAGGKRLIGAYYGYLFEYGNLGYCMQAGGHNALHRLLQSPDIDFLLSPNSYGCRTLGAPGADMKPFASVALGGKFSILEDDTRTHLTPGTGFYQTLNLPHTRAVLRRNWGMALSRKMPLNHLPLVGGNDLDDPALRADLQKVLKAGQTVFERNLPRRAEIAVVIDEQSPARLAPSLKKAVEPDTGRFQYSARGELLSGSRQVQPLTGDLLYYQRIALGQIGAPVDYLLLEDVPPTATQYKLIIFLNAFADSPALEAALQAAKSGGAVVLVVYGTGFLTADGIDASRTATLLDLKLARIPAGNLQFVLGEKAVGADYPVNPRFAVTDPGAQTLAAYEDHCGTAVARKGNVIFHGGAVLDTDWLRDIARRAGVHIYLETGDNLEAGSGILSIHSKSSGNKTLHLPEAATLVDLFTGETVLRNGRTVTIPMTAFETRVFFVNPAIPEKVRP